MANKPNNMMQEINRLLAHQNFKDEKELRTFLDGLIGKPLSDLPPVDLTAKEQAQDLVTEAYDLSLAKAKKNIEKALELDPDCIEAYEFLAFREKKPEKIREYLEKGIAIGRKKFGDKFLDKHKGHFWVMHETRPFMRCLYHKAELFTLAMQDPKAAIEIQEEMLELNPNDNQGVRYSLLSNLIAASEDEKFRRYEKMYADDQYSAAILYSRALFAFKTEGDTANTRKLLLKAIETNPFVPYKLLNTDEISLVKSYSPGSPEEADDYLLYGYHAWVAIEDAEDWLMSVTEDFIKEKSSKIKLKSKK